MPDISAMVRERCIPVEAQEAWSDAVSGVPHSIVHTWGYCHALWLSSRRFTYLYCLEEGDTRVVCPLTEREFQGNKDVVTPYGIGGFTGSGDSADVAERWFGFARSRGYICGYITLNPLFTKPAYYGREEPVRDKTLYVMDLRQTESELFRGLSENRRRQLRHWDSVLADYIVPDTAAVADFFVAQYPVFMSMKRAAPVYCLSSDTLRSLCDLRDVLLVGAGENGKIEAAAMFGYTPFCGDYLFGLSNPGSQKYAAALLWWGVKALKELGVPFLNLGGGVHEGDRLAEFKRRFGGLELPLKALRQMYRRREYETLCRLANVDPADRIGYFPAYHRPR